MGSPPVDDEEELIVTGGIDDVVKIWKYRYSSGTAEKMVAFNKLTIKQ